MMGTFRWNWIGIEFEMQSDLVGGFSGEVREGRF